MDFWSVFFKESLQTPWMWESLQTRVSVNTGIPDSQVTLIQRVSQSFSKNFRVFVFPPDISEELHGMMKKMVFGLGYKSDEVSLLGLSVEGLDGLENCQKSGRVLFFGDQYPGLFGEFVHWSGHKIIKTHGLDLLKSQPELKKETWEHLKKYGSVQ